MESLGSSLVDLNPHQIDAALKAYHGPLQTGRGILLADEVGLGKTVEALLIVSQFWAKGQRNILLLVPASLRAQWKAEIEDKFAVPASILDSQSRTAFEQASARAHEPMQAVWIATPQFAYRNIELLSKVGWHLLVIDEAHRLRNAHRRAKSAKVVRDAFEGVPKLLLTATPLQNHLDELYGLMTFIDPNLFGDLETFNYVYRDAGNLEDLRARIDPYMARTLRRQVQEYVRFTERKSAVHNFRSGPVEQELYARLAAFLQRDRIPAFRLTESKRGASALILMTYWRLLASSTAALGHALERLAERLEFFLDTGKWPNTPVLPEEMADVEEEDDEGNEGPEPGSEDAEITPEEVRADLDVVHHLLELARQAERDEQEKVNQLISALQRLFAAASEAGRPEKAVIFTEFRRTQDFLVQRLSDAGFDGEITVFNGSSGDAARRRALVDEFRTKTRIFVSTEAGSEGLNLQFCSILINFDLPWNPQRIEQRIGRCHRYGQEHDVVVSNLINLENEAEARLHELLQAKLHLFDGLFGASDEVLGALGSGLDFEHQVLRIMKTCRSKEEIAREFELLQEQYEDVIQSAMQRAREQVLNTFDQDVAARLEALSREIPEKIDHQTYALRELVHHCTTAETLQRTTDAVPGEFEVFCLRTDDQLHPLQSGGRLITFARLPRDVAPQIERVNLGHPLISHLIERLRAAEIPQCELALRLPKMPRAALLDDLYGAGKRAGAWLAFRASARGSEQVNEVMHVILPDGGEAPIVGEMAERFLRAIPVGADLVESLPLPRECVAGAVAAEHERFQTRISELYEDLYFRRREELDLRIFDQQQHLHDRIHELETQLHQLRRRARGAKDLKTKRELMDQADTVEGQLNRARIKQNELLVELGQQKEKELRRLGGYLDVAFADPLLVAACRWTLVE